MRHFDDIQKFIAEYDNVSEKPKDEVDHNDRMLIEEEVEKICQKGRFPEWLYRHHLRGHYKTCEDFITKVCDRTLCDNQALMIKYAHYTLEVLERTPDAHIIKIYEENGISNFKDLSIKAFSNTVNIILKTQRNIIQDLDSPVIEVRQEAAKLAVKIVGPKMATHLPSQDNDTSDQETTDSGGSEIEDAVEIHNQIEGPESQG
jgi:hypothetical protein